MDDKTHITVNETPELMRLPSYCLTDGATVDCVRYVRILSIIWMEYKGVRHGKNNQARQPSGYRCHF